MKELCPPWILDELLEELKTPNPENRISALWKLESLGTHRDLRVVEPLIEALGDPVPDVRGTAAHSLGTISSITKSPYVAKQALEPLITLLEDEDETVVASAIYALGELGGKSVGPRLLPFLNCPNKPHVKIRNIVIVALGASRYRPAIPHLRRLLDDSDPEVRYEALDALFCMWDVDDSVEEILKSLLDDPRYSHDRVQLMLEIIAEGQSK